MPALDFPSSPTNGQVFGQYTYDSTKGAWRVTSNSAMAVVPSATPPTSPVAGNLWLNTNDGVLFVYYDDGNSAQWVEVKSNTASGSTVAARVDVLEQNPNITGTLTVAGTATFNGYIKAPNTPAFLAQPTSNNNASNAVGVFTSVALNSGNCYSTSTGRFTAPVAGSYMFTGAAMPQASTTVEFWRFRKNGVKVGSWTYAINNDQILSNTIVIPLAVNDYVDMFFVSDGYEYLFTSFSGHFIG